MYNINVFFLCILHAVVFQWEVRIRWLTRIPKSRHLRSSPCKTLKRLSPRPDPLEIMEPLLFQSYFTQLSLSHSQQESQCWQVGEIKLSLLGQRVIKFYLIFLSEYYCVVSLYMICINPISLEKLRSYKDCLGPHFFPGIRMNL